MSESTRKQIESVQAPAGDAAPPAAASSAIDRSEHSQSSEGRRQKRRSSLFAAAQKSFRRSRGQSGAGVDKLRGVSGADFEGYATVHRGSSEELGSTIEFLCCMGGGGGKDGLYFLLIKGSYLFVFKHEESAAPTYAVEMINHRAKLQPSHASHAPRMLHPGGSKGSTYTTVNFESGLGDVEYQFTFDITVEPDVASSFVATVSSASAAASTELARKRLGHGDLLTKRGSARFAEVVGIAKTKDQPETPISAGEVAAGMPVTEIYA